jgi:uncharacterized membrane protein YoaK (UPF0700 family)
MATKPDNWRIRHLLLVALTISCGAVDALSWLGLGKVFSAFMTGNLAFLGFRLGGAPGPSVPRVLAATAAFALGAFLAARIVRRSQDPDRVWPRPATLTGCFAGVPGRFPRLVGVCQRASIGRVRRPTKPITCWSRATQVALTESWR